MLNDKQKAQLIAAIEGGSYTLSGGNLTIEGGHVPAVSIDEERQLLILQTLDPVDLELIVAMIEIAKDKGEKATSIVSSAYLRLLLRKLGRPEDEPDPGLPRRRRLNDVEQAATWYTSPHYRPGGSREWDEIIEEYELFASRLAARQ